MMTQYTEDIKTKKTIVFITVSAMVTTMTKKQFGE